MSAARGDKGFTIIEVLAAVSVFALVAAGLAVTTIGGTKANNVSKQLSVATALAHDKVEQLRTLDRAVAQNDLLPGLHEDPVNPLTPLGRGNGFFMRRWLVVPNTPKIGLSQVVVSVAWNGPEPRSIRAITYVCANTKCG